MMVAASLAMRWSLSSTWNSAGFLEFASAVSTLILIFGAVIEEEIAPSGRVGRRVKQSDHREDSAPYKSLPHLSTFSASNFSRGTSMLALLVNLLIICLILGIVCGLSP